MRFMIVVGSQREAICTKKFQICADIIKDIGHQYDTEVNMNKLMRVTKGSVSPANGFAILAPENSVTITPITNYVELIKWLDKMGMFPV